MRLSAIEAVRYGGLENACVSGLGEGLTVVLGPNESGKSTLTSLTRHVLYGYPDKRIAERRYEPVSGGRHGRLIFTGALGEWAIERVDGSKGGAVSIQALSGPERPELLSEVTAGVSGQTFKVVFGFGLDELKDIEQGDASEIVARLYAASAGLAVNPMDVRAKIKAQADELFAQVKSTRRANTLAQRLRETKERIRELEARATEYSADQRRLAELTAALEPLKEERDALEAEAAALAGALQRARDASEQEAKYAEESATLAARAEELRRAIEMLDVDERVLAAAPSASAVLEDLSGFRQRLDAVSAAQAEAAEAQRQVSALGALPEAGVDSQENRAAVERWRDRLLEARTDARAAEQSAQAAQTRATSAAAVAAEAAASTTPAARTSPLRLPGIIAVVLGVAAAGAGAVTGQWIAVALGALVAVGGHALALLKTRVAQAAPVLSEEHARLLAESRAARDLAASAAARLSADEQEWRDWLSARHLDANGEDPVAVRALLDSLARRAQLLAEVDRASAVVAREREAAQAWVARLCEVVVAFDPSAAQPPSFDGALELAARVRHTIQRAVEADQERKQLAVQLEAVSAQRERVDRQLAETRQTLAQLAERFSAPQADLVPVLQARVAQGRERLGEVRQRAEAGTVELERLRGRLDAEGHDDAMARARQEYEGLRAQAAQAADGYVVNALALELLDRARELYERERQPEMIRIAARVFSEMTDGRYTDVRVPLGASAISVISSAGQVFDTSKLSRGTAEQLYLALRVGLISSLGETGRSLPVLMDDVVVNFDPERRHGAVAAVNELSAQHQVVFFTCHPDTADALCDAVTGARLVQLDRCSV